MRRLSRKAVLALLGSTFLLIFLSAWSLLPTSSNMALNFSRNLGVIPEPKLDFPKLKAALQSAVSPAGQCFADPLPCTYDETYVLSTQLDKCLDVAASLRAPACSVQIQPTVPAHLFLNFLEDKPEKFYQEVGKKASLMVKSILVTQEILKLNVTLWTNDIARARSLIQTRLHKYISFALWNVTEQIQDTPLKEHLRMENWAKNDEYNWLGGDLMRMIVVYKYGGLYMDLDFLLLRDLSPLLSQNFLLNWSCQYKAINGAIFYSKEPKNLFTEVLLDAAVMMQDAESQFSWGRDAYRKILHFYDLAGVRILPNCFMDAAWGFSDGCDRSESKFSNLTLNAMWNRRSPDFIKAASDIFPGAFGFHWHNHWDVAPLVDSPVDILFKSIDDRFDIFDHS